MNGSDLASVVAVVFVWIIPAAAVGTLLWLSRSRRTGVRSRRQP